MTEENMLLNINDRTSDIDEVQVRLSESQITTCGERLSLLFKPIQSIQTKYVHDDPSTCLIIIPEAFRIWYYVFLLIIIGIGYVLTTIYVDLDPVDNPIYNLYGVNNLCNYLDYAPFTYFAATLWSIDVLFILLYHFCDFFRVYDHYIDHKLISKQFFVIYASLTIFESFAAIWSIQTMATQPEENILVHSIPYFVIMLAWWTMATKKWFYMRKIGIFDNYSKCYSILGWIYVISLFVSVIINQTIGTWVNAFGARLWTKPGWEWTQSLMAINRPIFVFFVLVAPIISYFIFTKDLEPITFMINRKSKKATN
eukprot:285703_1